ncbi:MAG: GtrA family protein [Prevotella sp.]|nr:GtrA family protein [Prevotella sp.]
MQIKDIISPSGKGEHEQKIGEIVRFIIVGVTATAIQYGIYLLMILWFHPLVANTIGYLVSFVFNYVASTHYTFRVKSTASRGAGFTLSHVVNYLLQTVCLHLFLWAGLSKQIAMIPMFCICVPVNFILVRFFLKRK